MMATAAQFDADEFGDLPFKRLSAQEALALRIKQPPLSPWRVVGWQAAVGFVVALFAWFWTGRTGAGWSAAYGALAVVLPAALFARGLMSRFSSINAVTASFGFFVWEALKLAMTVVMLAAASRLVTNLDWLALLVGLVLTLKVYWMALLLRPKRLTD